MNAAMNMRAGQGRMNRGDERRMNGRWPGDSSGRPGMLLMVVLGLLALFSMIGVSFVLITAEAERSAKATFTETSRRSTSPELLREAAMRVFRGTSGASWGQTPIGAQNLLTDMYGMPVEGSLGTGATIGIIKMSGGGDEWLEMTSDLATQIGTNFLQAEEARLMGIMGESMVTPAIQKEAAAMAAVRLAGMYLGFSNGDVYQILSWGTSPILKPVSLTADTQRALVPVGGAVSYSGQTYSLYRPFGGTGVTQATGVPETTANDFIPYEMLPGIPPAVYKTSLDRGGDWNEDYDSPDFQNMHLAYAVFDGTRQQVVLPSYWRPDLIAYWYRRAAVDLVAVPLYVRTGSTTYEWAVDGIDWSGLANELATLSRLGMTASDLNNPMGRVKFLEGIRGVVPAMDDGSGGTVDVPETASANVAYIYAVRRFSQWLSFRPAGPAFTGGNSKFGIEWNGTAFVTGPLDVDNDGDGVPDSVWVDFGLPEQTDADGNRIKPIVAVHCIDLDGRLNVNAHGNDMHIPTPSRLLGRGFGPAEIVLPVNMQQMLYGDLPNGTASRGIEGRLGEWGSSQPRGGYTLDTDGNGVLQNPSGAMPHHLLSNQAAWNRFMPMMLASGALGGAVNPDSLYGTFGDPLGLMYTQTLSGGAFGSESMLITGDRPVDVAGTAGSRLLSGANSNYWVDLTTPRRRSSGGKVQIDNAFTAAELERLLRGDADRKTLAPRLEWALGGPSALAAAFYTTDSYHVPATPAVELPQYVPSADETATAKNTEYLVDSASGLPIPQRYGALSEALLRYLRVMEHGGNDYTNAAIGVNGTSAITGAASGMVSAEFYAGLPLDPNRLFSDEQYLIANPGVAIPPAAEITAGRAERQAMARQLYVLAKFLTRHWKPDFSGVTLADLPTYKKIPSAVLSGLSTAQREEAIVSIWLAQWAVNVVDFRDRDSAMTPFWFDPFPDAVTGGDTLPGWTTNQNNLICVFGCERPDLLITETLATHMRRTEDTAVGGAKTTDTSNPDQTFDQLRRPIGSLFVELYNPWGAGEAAPSPELRAGNWSDEMAARSVDLGRTHSGTTSGTPVWRMGVRSVEADKSASVTFELEEPEVLGLPFERVLYFVKDPAVPTDDTGDTVNSLRFSATMGTNGPAGNPAPVVRPGEPIVIGPYDPEWKTKTPLAKGEMEIAGFKWAETRHVDLRNSGTGGTGGLEVHYNHDPTASTTNGIDPFNLAGVLTLAVDRVGEAGNWKPAGGDSARFSVSEPLNQVDPFYAVKWGVDPNGLDPNNDYYYTIGQPVPAQGLDKEIQKNGCAGQQSGVGTEMPRDMYKNRLVYLQRLADPRLPFDAVPTSLTYNPYITIDRSPIDLVTYNGWNPGDDVGGTKSMEPNPTDPTYMKMVTESTVVFRSRERGYFRQNNTLLAGSGLNLWSQEPVLDQTVFGGTQTLRELANFKEMESYTIPGFTKTGGTVIMDVDPATGAKYFHQYLSHSFGAPVNLCFAQATLSGGTLIRPTSATWPAVPSEYFSLLTWNNSPYNSRMELMYVPNTSASRLLAAPIYAPVSGVSPWSLVEPGFALVSDGTASYEPPTVVDVGGTAIAGDDEVVPGALAVTVGGLSGERADGRWYPHMMNFFDTGPVRVDDPAAPTFRYSFASNFGKILDFIDTPSPYAGAQAWRREPGRINLNTIPAYANGSATEVWSGVAGNAAVGDFTSLATRMGYSSGTFDGKMPSIFPNPVRASSMFGTVYNGDPGGMYPVLNAAQAGGMPEPTPSHLGMLRADPAMAGEPVLKYHEVAGGADSKRNVRFRYEQMQRMANLTTTRSNVYAVWVTLGYFRVMGQDPDGRPLLGPEVEGKMEIPDRPRAFYIFDRSIPTGYQPGSDRGADRAVLLRRIINE